MNGQKLISKHEALNDFAKHHQNKGGQEAHRMIKEIWHEVRQNPRDGSEEGQIRDSGFDDAFSLIIGRLQKRSFPKLP